MRCRSIREIEDSFERLGIGGGWLFRGQADSGWALETALERAVRDPQKRQSAEIFAFQAFRRSAHLYENLLAFGALAGSNLNDFWLSFMQHHGVPTRFFDFTESVYIAAYFALERAVSGATASSIWALNMPHCAAEFSRKYDGQPKNGAGTGAVDFGNPQNPPLVMPCRRDIGYTRILHQQGFGLLPLRVDLSFVENLAGTFDYDSPYLFRFDIPIEFRGDILNNLYTMNITRETLFPGIQGLGERIAVSMESGIFKSR